MTKIKLSKKELNEYLNKRSDNKRNGFLLFKEARLYGPAPGGFGDAGLEAEDNIDEARLKKPIKIPEYKYMDLVGIRPKFVEKYRKPYQSDKLVARVYNVNPDEQSITLFQTSSSFVKDVLKLPASEVYMIRQDSTLNEGKEGHKYTHGCLMSYFNIPNWTDIVTTIDPEDIYDEPGFGLETEPHSTILFGFLPGEVSPEEIQNTVNSMKNDCINIELTDLSIFDNPDYDVLKFDINSDDLKALNAKMVDFPHETNYPDYHPHMTVAYLKKGMGMKYAKKLAETIKLKTNKMVYSYPDTMGNKQKTEWELPAVDNMNTDGTPLSEARLKKPIRVGNNWEYYNYYDKSDLVYHDWISDKEIEIFKLDYEYVVFVDKKFKTVVGSGFTYDDLNYWVSSTVTEARFKGQTREEKLRQNIQPGDWIVTLSGLKGIVTKRIDEDGFFLDISYNSNDHYSEVYVFFEEVLKYSKEEENLMEARLKKQIKLFPDGFPTDLMKINSLDEFDTFLNNISSDVFEYNGWSFNYIETEFSTNEVYVDFNVFNNNDDNPIYLNLGSVECSFNYTKGYENRGIKYYMTLESFPGGWSEERRENEDYNEIHFEKKKKEINLIDGNIFNFKNEIINLFPWVVNNLNEFGRDQGLINEARLKKPIKKNKIYKIYNKETKEVEEWTMEDILYEINRDHSDHWIDYTEEDWIEGWDEWVEGDHYYSRFIPDTDYVLVRPADGEGQEFYVTYQELMKLVDNDYVFYNGRNYVYDNDPDIIQGEITLDEYGFGTGGPDSGMEDPMGQMSNDRFLTNEARLRRPFKTLTGNLKVEDYINKNITKTNTYNSEQALGDLISFVYSHINILSTDDRVEFLKLIEEFNSDEMEDENGELDLNWIHDQIDYLIILISNMLPENIEVVRSDDNEFNFFISQVDETGEPVQYNPESNLNEAHLKKKTIQEKKIESIKKEIMCFHVGRGGRFNNQGFIRFLGNNQIGDYTEGLFCSFENQAELYGLVEDHPNLLEKYEECLEKEDFTWFKHKFGFDIGELIYFDFNGNNTGLTEKDVEIGIGLINNDGDYDSTYCKYLEDCSDKELELIYNSNQLLSIDIIEYIKNKLIMRGLKFDDETTEEELDEDNTWSANSDVSSGGYENMNYAAPADNIDEARLKKNIDFDKYQNFISHIRNTGGHIENEIVNSKGNKVVYYREYGSHPTDVKIKVFK